MSKNTALEGLGIRVFGWRVLILSIIPVLFMACNVASGPIEEPFVPAEGATVIEDLKVAFMLPEGWWQNGDPLRTTAAGLLEHITPEQREMLKKTDPDRLKKRLDELETGLNMYIHHNLPAYQDSLDQQALDDLFFHMLSIEVHTYYEEDKLQKWAQGRCNSPETYCDENMPQLELISALGPAENPFSGGTGVLYKITNADVPIIAFVYYLARDGWAYRIKYELTEKDLGDNPYPPLLDTIQFMP